MDFFVQILLDFLGERHCFLEIFRAENFVSRQLFQSLGNEFEGTIQQGKQPVHLSPFPAGKLRSSHGSPFLEGDLWLGLLSV